MVTLEEVDIIQEYQEEVDIIQEEMDIIQEYQEEVDIIQEYQEEVDTIQESMEEVDIIQVPIMGGAVIIPDITAIIMTLWHSPLKELIVVVEE